MYKNFIKRIFDFLVALTALIVLSPIFILVMIGLFFANQGKPFFFQPRPGKGERVFKIIKFKSMNDKKDANGNLLSDAERLTKVGAFVRKTSLDEIPQLINVLKGDMSLIGPRPLLVRYLPFYTEEESARHNVRPGITGWAQVNGRNTIGWDKRLAYDVEYVHQVSFILDLKIIFKTIKNVLARKDIVIIPGKKGQLLDIARSKDKLVLRKLALKDLDLRVSWLNNKAINETMNLTLPIIKEDTVNWFKKNQSNPDRVDLVLESSVELIGMTGFSNKSKGIVDSYTFMNPDLKGKGFGTICLFMKMVYGFNIFGLVKTVSVIDFDNIASRKMVEKLGFKLIKVVENDLYKNGNYIDRCYYECTNVDFNYNYLPFTQYKGVVVYDPNDK